MAETKFEKALECLEKIVDDLESGSLSLDDSLKAYEEGVKLVKMCSKKLNEAEKKIEILTKEEGKLVTKPFLAEED
ncbi:MAG: exodeoxyribonuclease VII small subunit [Candidatus Omnitrophica bacterium]|nr:exodeoxyribonuclease VII small subunit [Candidatus Omnitrophota bacterium]